jgi:regulatory protein RepA
MISIRQRLCRIICLIWFSVVNAAEHFYNLKYFTEEIMNETKSDISKDCVIPYDLSKWSLSRFNGEPNPMKFLVSDLIPLGVAGTFYSAGGIGKSTLALDLCIRVAIAEEIQTLWLGKYDVLSGGKVMYLSAEDPEIILHERIHGLQRALSQEIGKDLGVLQSIAAKNLFIGNFWGSASKLFDIKGSAITPTDEYSRTYETLRTENVKLIVFDTRSRLSGAEGSGNAIVSQEVSYFEKLAADFGLTVLILHHTSKHSYGGNVSPQAAQRGESAFVDCLRFGLYLQPVSAEIANVNGIAEEDRFKFLVVSHAKSNYTAIQHPIILYRDGWRFTIADLQWNATREDRKAEETDKDIETVFNMVKKNPKCTQRGLIKLLKGCLSSHRIRKALQKALELKRIKEKKGDRGSKLYEAVEEIKSG